MSPLPVTTPRKLIAALRKVHFAEDNQKGSHIRLRHPDGRQVIIPLGAKDLKRGTLSGILKQAGVTAERLRELL